MSPSDVDIATLRAAYSRCFGCGLDNLHGLQLEGFTVDGAGVTAPFNPRSEFAGFEGVLHGGVIATALDEESAWSAMLTEVVFVYTAKLDIRYRTQADIGSEFVLRGTVIERRSRRLAIDATLSAAGRIVAESAGLFVVAEDVQPVL
jgi:acyl-coenzyme A thioesterase PaaI-like protein